MNTTETTYESQLAGLLGRGLEVTFTRSPDGLYVAAIDDRDGAVHDGIAATIAGALDAAVTGMDEYEARGEDDDLEPYCGRCGALIGIFTGYGMNWVHYQYVAGGIHVYLADDKHDPAISWAPAGAA